MKFSKKLLQAESLLPDLHQLCFRYKELKKLLHGIKPSPEHSASEAAPLQPDCDPADSGKDSQDLPDTDSAERAFFEMLHQDVKRLNDYFCDKEEEVIIRLQQLDEQLAAAQVLRDQQLCHIGYIHLHGQLVLLFHWSMLNYAALVKILKKHDKVSSREIKAPVLANALKQPFSTTGVLSTLMAKCEAKARDLEALTGGLESLLDACPQYQGLFLVKETEAALDLWTDLRSNASTPSTFVDTRLAGELQVSLRKRSRSGELVSSTGAGALAGGVSPPAAPSSPAAATQPAAGPALQHGKAHARDDHESRTGTASGSGTGSPMAPQPHSGAAHAAADLAPPGSLHGCS